MSIEHLEGAESRDKFKKYHKQADEASGAMRRLACDIDPALAKKEPEPGIAAIFDYKQPQDNDITPAEAFIYQDLMKHYPVYLIHGDKCVIQTPIEEQLFTIEKIENITIDKTGPNWYEVTSVDRELVAENIPWGGSVQDHSYFGTSTRGLIEWEDRLRFNELDV